MPKLLDEYSLLAIKQFVEGKTEVDANGPSANSNKLITSGAVYAAIEALPEPMLFKGSLGTGGTITSLPTAGAGNEGFTYKVIEAGTYAGQVAKLGDTFICAKTGASSYSWVLIPSGDEPEGTVTNVDISNDSQGTLDITGGPITTTGTVKVKLADAYGDTKNPYGSKTANTILAAPNGSNGAPSFRALVAADIPNLDASKINAGTFAAALIPDLSSNYVNRTTAQEVGGLKTLTDGVKMFGEHVFTVGYAEANNSTNTGQLVDFKIGGSDSRMMSFEFSSSATTRIRAASITPYSDQVHDSSLVKTSLGAPTLRWDNLYLSGLLHDGTNSISIANIASKNYVDTNGGKIDKIQVNGTDLTITNKVVNITNLVTNDGGTSSSYEVIGGHKKFTNTVLFDGGISSGSNDLIFAASGVSFKPNESGEVNLGTSNNRWGNLWLSGNINGTSVTTIIDAALQVSNVISQNDAFAVLSTGVLSS